MDLVLSMKKALLASQYLNQFGCLFVDDLKNLPHVDMDRLELLLTFVRNMVHISDSAQGMRTESHSVHVGQSLCLSFLAERRRACRETLSSR